MSTGVSGLLGDLALAPPDWPKGLEVVLVDDAHTAAALADQMRGMEYEVEVATSAQAAETAMATRRRDILVVAAGLLSPGLAECAAANGVPLLLLTPAAAADGAGATPSTTASSGAAVWDALDAGAAGVLHQPVPPARLRTLWQFAARAAAGRASSGRAPRTVLTVRRTSAEGGRASSDAGRRSSTGTSRPTAPSVPATPATSGGDGSGGGGPTAHGAAAPQPPPPAHQPPRRGGQATARVAARRAALAAAAAAEAAAEAAAKAAAKGRAPVPSPPEATSSGEPPAEGAAGASSAAPTPPRPGRPHTPARPRRRVSPLEQAAPAAPAVPACVWGTPAVGVGGDPSAAVALGVPAQGPPASALLASPLPALHHPPSSSSLAAAAAAASPGAAGLLSVTGAPATADDDEVAALAAVLDPLGGDASPAGSGGEAWPPALHTPADTPPPPALPLPPRAATGAPPLGLSLKKSRSLLDMINARLKGIVAPSAVVGGGGGAGDVVLGVPPPL